MYASHASEYEKYSGIPQPTVPLSALHSYETPGIATGIPMNSTSGEYSDNSRPPPPARIPLQILPKTRGPWSTGLCDCFSDPKNCKYFTYSSFLVVVPPLVTAKTDRSMSVN